VDGGEEDDGDVPVAGAVLDQLRRLDSVDPGHLHVHQDQGEVRVEQLAERLLSRIGQDQVLPERVEDGRQRHQVRRMIVDHQDPRGGRVRLDRLPDPADHDGRGRDGWESSVHLLAQSRISSSSLSGSTGLGR